MTDVGSSFDACRIDFGDEATDDYGNAVFEVGSGSRDQVLITCSNGVAFVLDPDAPDKEADFTLWAWSGALGDPGPERCAQEEWQSNKDRSFGQSNRRLNAIF